MVYFKIIHLEKSIYVSTFSKRAAEQMNLAKCKKTISLLLLFYCEVPNNILLGGIKNLFKYEHCPTSGKEEGSSDMISAFLPDL